MIFVIYFWDNNNNNNNNNDNNDNNDNNKSCNNNVSTMQTNGHAASDIRSLQHEKLLTELLTLIMIDVVLLHGKHYIQLHHSKSKELIKATVPGAF